MVLLGVVVFSACAQKGEMAVTPSADSPSEEESEEGGGVEFLPPFSKPEAESESKKREVSLKRLSFSRNFS